MARSRSQDLYISLYLFFARELAGAESSTIDITKRFPDGVWTTRLVTGCGMFLHRPPLHAEPVYRKSPTNTAVFANTGEDGIFYSFLEADGPWSDASPVVVTFPTGTFDDDPSVIVGGRLRDFLRLGRWVGFSALGGLVGEATDGSREAIRALSVARYPEWVQTEERAQLDRLATCFKLKPLTDVANRITDWQRRYRPLVRHTAPGT